MDARHGQWSHAGIHLFRHPVVLHHLRAVVETAGLALHDEEPERIARLLDQAIANFSLGSCRPRACGKCRQRGLEPPSNEANPTPWGRAPKRGLPLIPDILVGRQCSRQNAPVTRNYAKMGGFSRGLLTAHVAPTLPGPPLLPLSRHNHSTGPLRNTACRGFRRQARDVQSQQGVAAAIEQ